MKILKILPFVLLVTLLGLGIYFALGFEKQLENQNYADFVKASTNKTLEETNKQSKGINGVENLSESEESTLKNLETISEEFKTTLKSEKEGFNSQKKPSGSEALDAKVVAFYDKAEEVNKEFDELVSDVKSLENSDLILEKLKNYNKGVSELSDAYDEFASEMTKFIDSNSGIKL